MAVATTAAALRSRLFRPNLGRCTVRGLCDQAKADPNEAEKAAASKGQPGPSNTKKESNETMNAGTTPKGEEDTSSRNDGQVELEQLVTASLEAAKTHGWSTAALQAGATSLGWSPAAAGMVRGGGGELALYHIQRSNRAFATMLADKTAEAGTGTGRNAAVERVVYAVRSRLEYNVPYRHNWASALRQLASTQAVCSARETALLADEIAHYAGYRTPSAVWYMDRAALATLYHATELFWLADPSQDQTATWVFLRSYTDVALSARGAIEGVAGNFADASGVGLATIRGLTRAMRAR